MIGKVEERTRGREFLSLKEHRRARPEQEERGERPVAARRGELMQPAATRGVGHLIVILDKGDDACGLEVQRRGAAALVLPPVSLALQQMPPFRGRDQLLWSTGVI